MRRAIDARLKLRSGELVEIRSREEIVATLDKNARLDGLPFMPEMFQYCGMRFRVYKRAHKTCDTVFPIRGRRMANAVHLETRCDGSAHGGCQAGCLIFWREAWLKPVKPCAGKSLVPVDALASNGSGCTESAVRAAAETSDAQDGVPKYVCQATQFPYATTSDLPWWDIRQYIEDYLSGNVSMGRLLQGLVYSSYYSLIQAG